MWELQTVYKISCVQLFLVMFNSNAVGVLFRSLASLGFEHITALGDASAHGSAASTLLRACSADSDSGSGSGSAHASKTNTLRLPTPLRADGGGNDSPALSSSAFALDAFRSGESSSSPLCPHLPLMSLFSALFQQAFSSEDLLQYDLICYQVLVITYSYVQYVLYLITNRKYGHSTVFINIPI